MPGDFSRKTFDKKKHYSGVLMQQGRVQLDADWNEELDIEQYRTFTETKDVIGAAGVPKKNNGFKITATADGSDLIISPGRIYVEGLLCELEPNGVTTYKNQPYYPSPDVSLFGALTSPVTSPPGIGLADGSYIVYLKAWQREINYLDDPYIQEKALGEADTTTRLQTVWQVKLHKVEDANGTGKCNTVFPEWNEITEAITGKLNAQTKPPADNNNPCVLPPKAGYLRLENQLYRIQVQKVNSAKKVQSFKWSRDNASIETTFEVIADKIIRVADLGKDDVLAFAGNQWVEIVDDVSEFGESANQLLQIDSIDPDAREITLKTSVLSFQNKKNLKLRRWDMGAASTQDGIAVTSGWQDIEDGIQVNFEAGTYEAGDYWLIPARTATGDIEWPRTDPGLVPVAQSRKGTEHFYCRLALAKVSGGKIVFEDCRELFPSLTDICAEDICFNNKNCDFPTGAENVQQALDILCAANDLRDHNKHLHGYGVVCGLKVICGTDRRFVKVETGYALDCEGNVIRNKTIQNFDVIAAATAAGISLQGKVPVCISIAYNGANAPTLHVEPFVKQSLWNELLEGTLLKEFLEGCIKSLFDALKSELGLPLQQTIPVPIAQRRLTSVINLLYQLINAKSGPYAFLSGQKGEKNNLSMCLGGKLEDKTEHELLYCFYEKLKILLASETYCAQVEHKAFPEYPLDAGERTIFGKPLKTHRKLKISPEGDFAYTAGGDNKIYVYDLKTEELVKELTVPGPTVQIKDICLLKKGTQLVAVALAANGTDSVFASASLGGNTTWSGPFTAAGIEFMSLARPANKERLLAIGKSRGLFDISFAGTVVKTSLIASFNATGLFAVNEDGELAFAAIAGTPVSTPEKDFTSIRMINLNTNQTKDFSQTGTDADDDLIYYSNNIYFTGTAGGQRYISGVRNVRDDVPLSRVFLKEPGQVLRLAAVRQNSDIINVMVSMSDISKVEHVTHAGATLKMEGRLHIPVQVFPMAIAAEPFKEEIVYVLNTVVNTITAVQVRKVFSSSPPKYMLDKEIVARYRDEVYEAYKGLFTRLLQYLKDCFCDKFLIDCPQCTEKDKVYLGTIEIHDSEIYHICNFSKRKYVKTFRTVGYWFSVVPVGNLLKKAFTVFCCTVIDDLTKKP